MKLTQIITRLLFISCIPVFLLTGFLALAINSQWLYEHSFNTYGVEETTGIEKGELDKAATQIIRYFNSSDEFLSVTVVKDGADFVLFNEKEIAHMKDVKSLVRLDYYVLLGTGLFILLYIAVNFYYRRREFVRPLLASLFRGGSITIGLILILGIMAVADFDVFFTAFHMISFSNDFWLLDPNTDYLIMLFPGGFWYDCVIYIAIAIAISALLIAGVSWWFMRKGDNTCLPGE
jgi:integral membrane protein (TIGR01906 family)